MAYAFEDLIRPMTRAEAQQSIYSALATVGVNTTTWKPGAVTRTMLVSLSAVLAALTTLTAAIARSGYLELSDGDWLAAVARYVYGVEKDLATFATGYVQLTNTAGGLYEIGVGELIVTNVVTGKTYRNQVEFILDPMQADHAPIAVIADELGTASNAAAGQVTQIVTPLPGVDCTNPAAITARDDETDTELRKRCNERLGPLSPMGPWDAYSYAVKTAKRPDGSATLGITRVRLAKDGYGNVTLYLATPDAGVTSPDVAIAQDAIERYAVPQCVTATAVSATPKIVNLAHETWVYNTSAKTLAQIEDAIYKAVRDYMRAQPIGGNVIPGSPGRIYLSTLTGVIGAALPGLVIRTVFSAPAGDVDFSPHEVPILGTVLTTLHQEPTPEGHAP